jgi:hypothetical protein
MGHKFRKLRCHTSNDIAHCESTEEQGCSKGTNRDSWLFRPEIPTNK